MKSLYVIVFILSIALVSSCHLQLRRTEDEEHNISDGFKAFFLGLGKVLLILFGIAVWINLLIYGFIGIVLCIRKRRTQQIQNPIVSNVNGENTGVYYGQVTQTYIPEQNKYYSPSQPSAVQMPTQFEQQYNTAN